MPTKSAKGPSTPSEVREYMASIGRKGGQQSSERKRQAGIRNLKVARAVRLKRMTDETGDA